MELPVEVFVLQLLGIVAEKCRSNGKSVEAIARELAVGVAFTEVLHAGEVAERRHEVVEGELQVAHLACLHVSGPPRYERNAYAALVALALESAQFAVASEEFGVGAALLMRSVVGGEDDERVLVESLLAQLCYHLANVLIETGYHSGKLGVGMLHGVVA